MRVLAFGNRVRSEDGAIDRRRLNFRKGCGYIAPQALHGILDIVDILIPL